MNRPLINILNITFFIIIACLFIAFLVWFQIFGNHTVAANALREHTDFGTNPGNLQMFSYVPPERDAPAPLVVVLHGCGQGVTDIDEESGWVPYAKKEGFAVLFPQQKRINNLLNCFNWFNPKDSSRDQGEALSIRQMITTLQTQYDINPQQIYVTGLSAGGAMTAALLSNYPEVFKGGAIIAGVPYGCATGVYSAFQCQGGKTDLDPAAWGEKVRQATHPDNPLQPVWPIVSIWQGDADTTVDPINATELMEQWTDVHQIDQAPDNEEMHNQYAHLVYTDATGHMLVETFLIRGMGHGIPIAPGSSDKPCGTPGDYLLDVGICATHEILKTWGFAN